MDSTFYDADYYERGIESGKSCYRNYRWQPELTIPMAMTIIDYLGIKRGQTIIDFGCAKGYLVKAFRLLYRYSYGIETSEYALKKVDPEVVDFCKPHFGYSIFPPKFDFCIAKDVFEHIAEPELSKVITKLAIEVSGKMFVIVPLGNKDGFFAPANNMDVTHVTCKPFEWWVQIFIKNGWEPEFVSNRVAGIKDSYHPAYPDAHGFFVLINNK